MQGVVRTYDPLTGEGSLVRDTDKATFVLAAGALEHSILRILRQGQRVTFRLDDDGRATTIQLGSEVDMGLPTARV
jgi:cold shock CspA family protein